MQIAASRSQTQTLSATQTATAAETYRASDDAFESEAPSEFASMLVFRRLTKLCYKLSYPFPSFRQINPDSPNRRFEL